jgi:membrane protease YdiL (CAAX protease family)
VDRGLSPSSRPSAAGVVRWGIGDFLWIWPTGMLVSLVLASIGYGISGDEVGEPGALVTALAAGGQFGTWLVAMAFVSRAKGRSLRSDFGLIVRARDGWAVFAGMVLLVVLNVMVLPIRNLADRQEQDVVDQLEKAGGAKLVVLVLVAGLLAPVCEEMLFRGLLQRALRRRMAPWAAIAIASAVFALAHPLLDPTLGTLSIVPALFGLAVISGVAAERTGDLSVSILLHVGFNLVTVVGVIAVLG